MNGGFDDIYVQIYHVTNDMTRLYHITYNQYETNMTLLTKKGHMCFILKIGLEAIAVMLLRAPLEDGKDYL